MGTGSLDEERFAVVGRKWWDLRESFRLQPQCPTRGDDALEGGGCGQQLGDRRADVGDLLGVVEDEQKPALANGMVSSVSNG